MEYNFCRRCGNKLKKLSEFVFDCDNEHTTFAAASPTVGVFFINSDGKALLSRRAIEPFKGAYDTVGGFVDAKETFEQALEREIVEETGLTTEDYYNLTYLCSAPSIYPYQGENKDVLSVFYYAHMNPEAKPVAQDDVAELEFVDLNSLDMSKVGADDVRTGIINMREALKDL